MLAIQHNEMNQKKEVKPQKLNETNEKSTQDVLNESRGKINTQPFNE